MCVILIHNVILGVVCNEVRFMLNEERIKHMTKLAIYESQGGNKDLKAGLQYKKRYVAVNTFWSALWMTMAYIAMVMLVIVTLLSDVWKTLVSRQILSLIMSFLGIYIILLIAYIRRARLIYAKEHAQAYHRMKNFKEDLEQLEKMYEKEDGNE